MPVKYRVGSRPRKIISPLDCSDEREQDRNQESYITNIHTDQFPSAEQQIQTDAMLSRQFYEEEHIQFRLK